MTDGGTHAVISGVTAADDDNVLAFGVNISFIFKIGIQQALGVGFQEIHCKIDSLGISSGCFDISGIGGTTGQDDSVKIMEQLICLDIFAHISAGHENDTFLFHDFNLAVNDLLFQLHIWNTVHEQTAYAVGTLEYSDLMASLIQLVSCSQSGGTASYDGYTLAGAHLRRLRSGIAFFVGIFNDGIFIFLGRYGVSVQSAGAGCFAQCRTYSGGKLREIVSLLQTVICSLPVAGVYQVIPLRHQVVQGTSACHTADHHSCLTEGDAAFHAACSL